MGKFEKKKKKKSHKGIVVLGLIIVLAILLVSVMPQILYMLRGEENPAENEIAVTESGEVGNVPSGEEPLNMTEAAGVAFPLLLEDGKLEIESVFQFDGINPDCNNQEGAEIASITVKNLSDTYLESAEISMVSGNGIEFSFTVTDLPAGKTAIAFSRENMSAEAGAAYFDISCKAAFDPEATLHSNKISVSAEGTHITLQNNTGTEIEELVVYCRSALGDQYFGGITYTYTVNNLPANATAEVEAVDCILGIAEVVRIAIKES